MPVLRILRTIAVSNNSFRVQFSNSVIKNISSDNIVIVPTTVNIPTPRVLGVVTTKDVIDVLTDYFTPGCTYTISFVSTSVIKFTSLNGLDFLLEDGKNNAFTYYSAQEPPDDIKYNLLGYLQNNIYNLEAGSVARTVIDAQAKYLSTALHNIDEAASDNYLEVTIYDEEKTRGSGAYDRLNEEDAFEVTRVGRNKTDISSPGFILFDSFPKDPVTLQRAVVTREQLVIGSGPGTFDNLILTVKNHPVTILKKIVINYQSGSIASYAVDQFGYRIQNARYDTVYGSTLLTLDDNQFELSDSVLDSNFVIPESGDVIYVDYEYKMLGKIVDTSATTVTNKIQQIREATPPISTVFNLEFSNVVTSNDQTPTSNGVSFLDPFSDPPFSISHKAFIKEIPYKLDSLPAAIGEYCVDYPNGRVFVYGATKNDGSGPFPPAATYYYRRYYDGYLDYSVNPDTYELVALPNRELKNNPGKINFTFENNLVPGIDYNQEVHTEVINERINNRLASTNTLYVQNAPVTDALRVYNETSGEVYGITRFTDNSIIFNYNQPPTIDSITAERAIFTSVQSETLILDKTIANGSHRIFRFLLQNNNIIGSTEDCIGSLFNSSVNLARGDIFVKELYYDSQTETEQTNISRLTDVGKYMINYTNGIVYVCVSSSQLNDCGSINYKKSSISSQNVHIISVSKIYNSINLIAGANKLIDYTEFIDTEIMPKTFDRSDERFLNNSTSPYIYDNGNITVSDDIKTVRGVYDHYDLVNNLEPTNFGVGATVDGNTLTLDQIGVYKHSIGTVNSNQIVLKIITPGAEIVSVNSVIRISDGYSLWNNSGTFSGYTITLPGINTSTNGDVVAVVYNIGLNGGSTPIVDYDRGEYYVDYTYLVDEILVSYEYGDNVIDFRQSTSLREGETYYVTYKIGALRDALLNNFGTMIDIPVMQAFDTTINRELYRDALQGILSTFPLGPTIPAIQGLVSSITKIQPEIIEAIFQVWSLGYSNLYKNPILYNKDIKILPGKFDGGVHINSQGQALTFPVSSNLRIEEGTLEMWVIPDWDGLDNDATLTFSNLTLNGNILDASNIFIGSTSYNPTYSYYNTFTVSKNDQISPIGLPAAFATEKGMFIYYNIDQKRWVVTTNHSSLGEIYDGLITTSGEMYDVKKLSSPSNDVVRSYTDKIEFQINVDGYDGLSFMSDDKHYLFDFAETATKNRFSLYKDGKGYLTFEIFDNASKTFKTRKFNVSADISGWKAKSKHHVGIAWKLDTFDQHDEMHLFVDGFEVPNIIRFGGRPTSSTTDRFRTVKPEYVIGTIPKNIISGIDMVTTIGSNIVSSTTNFSALGVVPGDPIEIEEIGFGTYIINAVSGTQLQLNSTMPATLSKVAYVINKFSAVVSTQIDLYANIAVSLRRNTIDGYVEIEIPGVRATYPAYTIDKNNLLQNVINIVGDGQVGDQVVIRTLGLNFRRCRDKVYQWGNSQNILKTQMPPPINLDEVKVIKVILPLISINPSNSVVSPTTFVNTSTAYATTNVTEGRTLSVHVTGGNVDFSTPVQVVINGISDAGITETITFTAPAIKNTIGKWKTINSIITTVKPVDIAKPSVALEIKEAYSATVSDGNTNYPVIHFSYRETTGTGLSGSGNTITNGAFKHFDVGNKIVIATPPAAAGSYTILSVNGTTATIDASVPSFNNGTYYIYVTTIGRSGFQNGFFTFELTNTVATPYPLTQGYYEFDYQSTLKVKLDPINKIQAFIGSDFNSSQQACATIDEFRILSTAISDVRVGESIPASQKSITKDYYAISEFDTDSDTLMLLHMNILPIVNDTFDYKISDKNFVQAGSGPNSFFNQSLVVRDNGLTVDNAGRLSTTSEGTIEFWVSPEFDTYNDPLERYYFDASASVVSNVTSISKVTIKLPTRVSRLDSIRLLSDVNNTGIDYSNGAKIQSDYQTLELFIALPAQQTQVKVSYLQTGRSGDRISIYKNAFGQINFQVNANKKTFRVTSPVLWSRGTWHRIMCTYKFNRKDNLDEIRMFIDGEDVGFMGYGSNNLTYGGSTVYGQTYNIVNTGRLVANIDFKDNINEFYIGSAYNNYGVARARIDDFKISNISRDPLLVGSVPRDVYYQTNLNTTFPSIPDLFTTYLMHFDTLKTEETSYAILRDASYGIFNFIVNIFDQFHIVKNNTKVKQILYDTITALKPAQSKVKINILE